MTREPRYTVGSAAWNYGHAWTVYEGFTPMEGETYANAGLAQARTDYLNGRDLGEVRT